MSTKDIILYKLLVHHKFKLLRLSAKSFNLVNRITNEEIYMLQGLDLIQSAL